METPTSSPKYDVGGAFGSGDDVRGWGQAMSCLCSQGIDALWHMDVHAASANMRHSLREAHQWGVFALPKPNVRKNAFYRYARMTRFSFKSLPHLLAVITETIRGLPRSLKLAGFTAITLCLPVRTLALTRWRYWKLEPEEEVLPCGHSTCQPSHMAKMQVKSTLRNDISHRFGHWPDIYSKSSPTNGSLVELC